MKDFLKIFFVLCAVVASFLFGRNYGKTDFKQSEEYQNFLKAKEDQSFIKNDLENAKTKFQNIIDSAGTKKSEELLAQILQVFLADLGLHIQDQNSFIKQAEMNTSNINQKSEVKKVLNNEPPDKPTNLIQKEKKFNYKRLKSYEWILENSQNLDELKGNLKNVEIKNIDSFMKKAIDSKPQDMQSLYGSYRGRIIDVTQNEYATLSFDINPIPESDPMKLKGSIKIFKDEKETSSKAFTTTRLGYQVDGSMGFIIDNGNTYYQVYKIKGSEQIAGFYYERLVNGTTKTIGSFILNRVDRF